MCGIAGIFDLRGSPIAAVDLLRMNSSIAHRGPDDEGYVLINSSSGKYVAYAGEASPAEVRVEQPCLASGSSADANVGLAHRRFSILDLSPAGHQPFFSSDRSCCVVFNGEIYNYLELRDELEAKGVTFHSRSDTEVLIEGYKKWGTDCFQRFNGFWAIALYDFKAQRLILSRDRLGKKPLFWTRMGSTVYFASEIKALLEVDVVSRRRKVNEEALFIWLAYSAKNINNQSFFEGIQALPAGSFSIVDEEFPQKVVKYWGVPSQRLRETEISTEEAARSLRELLTDAVRIRLRADVPVCVELSGGMDSSTLVALAAAATSQRVTTFTVRYPEQQWNEEPYARSIGQRFNTDYRVLDSPTDRFWQQIAAFSRLEEEPYHSPNLQTNQEIWALMRHQGMKVSLNGAASDELFAGYPAFYAPAQAELLMSGRFSHFLDNLIHHTESPSRSAAGLGPFKHLAREVAKGFSPLARRRLRERMKHVRCGTFHPFPGDRKFLTKILYDAVTNTRIPYWLASGDRTYMGVPIEVRAPFLDYRVVELAFRLPVTYLFRHGWHKWILRKAMEGLLPDDVLWRRNKMGFPFPYERFFSESRPIIDLIISQSKNPYIDCRYHDRIANDWEIISFLLWYELFLNRNTGLFKSIEAKACQTPNGAPRSFASAFEATCRATNP
jgi:asparagine synthase (glutamine-hydrolysing)